MFDGMPERLYPCTPTRLATWRDCPRRYRFTYLDRPQPAKGPPWAHNSVGAATHTALAQWFGLPPARRSPARGGDLVRRAWLREGFRDDAQAAAARGRAQGWVERYLAGLTPGHQPVGVERTVSAATGTLLLSGRADRIDAAADGTLTIVDYKTGRWVPSAADAGASLALAAYAVGARRTMHRPCLRVELHHLPTGTVAVAEHTAASLAQRVAEAEAAGAGASGADDAYHAGRTGDAAFPAAPAARCSWCDFRRHCPQGRDASPGAEPWAGLAEPGSTAAGAMPASAVPGLDGDPTEDDVPPDGGDG
jgi:RecB family exonuclease